MSTPAETDVLVRDRYGNVLTFMQHFGKAFTVGAGGPQAFRVCMQAGMVGPAHFHDHDQFQVFFGGQGCTLGAHPVPPVCVHYTDGYTPYGPFTAGAAGMDFFTLRAEATVATMFMPAERSKLIRRPGRAFHSAVEGGQAVPSSATCNAIIDPQADGLAAYHLSIGAGASISAPAAAASGGQYCIVVAGEVRCQGKPLPFQSCVFVGPDENPPLVMNTMDSGSDVVVLQYPRPGPGKAD